MLLSERALDFLPSSRGQRGAVCDECNSCSSAPRRARVARSSTWAVDEAHGGVQWHLSHNGQGARSVAIDAEPPPNSCADRVFWCFILQCNRLPSHPGRTKIACLGLHHGRRWARPLVRCAAGAPSRTAVTDSPRSTSRFHPPSIPAARAVPEEDSPVDLTH